MKRVIISLVSILPFTLAACGGDSSSSDCTASAGANKAQYVVNTVTVPASGKDDAIDLNGDTKLDNQLGNIISTLSSQGLKVQDGVNSALMNGSLILLVSESSSDAMFQSDSCATTTMQLGAKTNGAPDFSGNGMFTLDSSQTPGTFTGPIKAGKFSSAQPATTKHPVSVTVQLPLVEGGTPVPLALVGAHVQYTRDSSGKLMGGQIHGAIKSEDVQGKIIPAVADLLTNKLATDNPPTSTDTQIQSLFDNGGTADASCADGTCKNPDGSCAVKNDKIISICEVSTNNLVKNLLGADVDMFDASGNYAPNKENTDKDSLSLGLAFTAVGAKF